MLTNHSDHYYIVQVGDRYLKNPTISGHLYGDLKSARRFTDHFSCQDAAMVHRGIVRDVSIELA